MLMFNSQARNQSQVRNFKQTSAPTGGSIGDLWVDISLSPPALKTLVSQFPDIWAEISTGGGGGASVTDHGQLLGLSDDDHSQYHTDARGDARYYTKAQVDSLTANAPAATTTINPFLLMGA